MYPREITTSAVWIRHNLPLSPPLPSNGDEKLYNQIRSQHVKSTDEMIEQYVRQERARLDLKWCLDEYFGWNVADPYLGQFVTANIFGFVHLCYIIDIGLVNVTITPVDTLGRLEIVGFDDIYSAEDGPFYEKFLLNHRLLHPQHILDYVGNQKLQEEMTQFNHNASLGTIMEKFICQNFDIEWPEGQDIWLIHDELPQRTQFVKCTDQMMLTTSTSNIVEYPVQKTLSECVCVTSSSTQQSNEIMMLIRQIMMKQDILIEENKLLQKELETRKVIINELVLTMEEIGKTKMSQEVLLSHESKLTTVRVLQPPSHLDRINVPDLKEETVKQLQFQQMDQLFKYPILSESYSQDMSNVNGDFNYKCDHNTKASSSKSTTFFSSGSTEFCISQLFLIGIILLSFMFISMAFSNLGGYRNSYGGKNTSYLVDNLVSHGLNNLDWFRVLAVP